MKTKPKQVNMLYLCAVLIAFAFIGTAVADIRVYEPFDYEVGGLDGQGDLNQVGLEGAWIANETAQVLENSLTYGSLPTTGGSIGTSST